MNTSGGMFNQVPRQRRSRPWREAHMEHAEEKSDQTDGGAYAAHQGEVALFKPSSVVGNGVGAPVESSASSGRPRCVRARKTVAAAEVLPEGSDGGNVMDDDSVQKDEESERQRRHEEYEKERLRKEKKVAEEQSPPSISGGEKLTGDAIRGGRRPYLTRTETKEPEHGHRKFWVGLGNNEASTSSAGSDMGASLDSIPVVGEHLRDFLKGLDVTLVRIYGKKMSFSDRNTSQNRLQMSRKSWHEEDDKSFPFDEILTLDKKLACVTSNPKNKSNKTTKKKKKNKPKDEDINEKKNRPKKDDIDDNDGEEEIDGDGLLVQTYDRTGELIQPQVQVPQEH